MPNYIDLNSVHDPATGNAAPAAWGDAIRDNCAALQSRPKIHVSTSIIVSIPNTTPTVIGWDAEGVKRQITHSNATSTSDITIVLAGFYMGPFDVIWDANTTGKRFAEIRKNGARLFEDTSVPSSPGGEATNLIPFGEQLAAGDVITVALAQTSGVSLGAAPHFRLVMVTD